MAWDFALSGPERRFCKSYEAIGRKDGSFLHKRFHFALPRMLLGVAGFRGSEFKGYALRDAGIVGPGDENKTEIA
jgi:hypothetical protein